MSYILRKPIKRMGKQRKTCVDLLNSVGTLMYDKGIELVLFQKEITRNWSF